MSNIDFIGYNIVILVRKINSNMTNNETKLYFTILQFLSKDSFINTKDITHLLAQYIETPKFRSQLEVTNYENNIMSFSERFKKANHLVCNRNYTGEAFDKNGDMCSKLRIHASLTTDGFLFLNGYLDRKASKRVTNFQMSATALTTFFIGLTALYAYETYQNGLKKDEARQPIVKQLQSQKSNKMLQQQIKTLPYPSVQVPKTHQIDSLKRK